MKNLFSNKKLLSIVLAVMFIMTSALSLILLNFKFGTKKAGAASAIREEYNSLTEDLSNLPISFVYGDKYFTGFSPDYFTKVSSTSIRERNGVLTTTTLRYDSNLMVTIKSCLYEKYNAYDYTVYFTNAGTSNTSVLKKVNAIDMDFVGNSPKLKGILGDKQGDYAPYEYNLKSKDVTFQTTTGRPTHVNFPYFNLEYGNGGAMLALGWGGTWKADFTYDAEENATNFKGVGTIDMQTYLKPGETIRTPLVAVVRYYERNEDVATNAWRRWMVDCNVPREGNTDDHAKPIRMVQISNDTGKSNSDGSISESYDTWQRSLESYYSHGLTADYRWFDAGWYVSPNGNSNASNWYNSVGTWLIDTVKWPGDTFKQSVDYAREHGTGTMVWFEPERIGNEYESLISNHGYKREWLIANRVGHNVNLNNLGNKEALQWTTTRILNFMATHGVDMYREDFNSDPAPLWDTGDLYQGANRKGITENLYVQGHYELWDSIIKYQKSVGGPNYVDSCASGGGRNDLETMRRAVANLRSDSDRTTIARRLSMTSTLSKWLPFSGTTSSESSTELGNGIVDTYTMRGSLLATTVLNIRWYHDANNGVIDWDELKQGEDEWKEGSQYLLGDFYTLSPYKKVTDRSSWVAWQYHLTDTDKSFVQVFRQEESIAKSSYTVKLKGLDDNKMYKIRDVDGVNVYQNISGKSLREEGITVSAKSTRTAVSIYVEPVA